MSKEEELQKVLTDIQKTLADAKIKGISVSKTKLAAEVQIRYGRTRRRSLEYLQTLQDAGLIGVDGDVVWLI